MKVTQVTTRILRTPADNPLVVGLPPGNETREFVTVKLSTDEGIEGIGLTFFGGPLTGALKAAVDALGQLVIGENPLHVEAISGKLRRAASGSGPGCLFTLALSPIDIALWDIKGQALCVPIYELLGRAVRETVPLYTHLQYSTSVDQMVENAVGEAGRGSRAIKTDPLLVLAA